MSEKSTQTHNLWIGKSACSHWAKTTTYYFASFTQYLNKVNMNLVLKKDLFPAGFKPAHSHSSVLSASPRLPGFDEIETNIDII